MLHSLLNAKHPYAMMNIRSEMWLVHENISKFKNKKKILQQQGRAEIKVRMGGRNQRYS